MAMAATAAASPENPAPSGHQSAPCAARTLRGHLFRPPVSRGLLQRAAKAFGVHIQGDVATNEVSTAKYTALTFLPVNLFEQFLRAANLYFLIIAILQFVPGLSPTSPATSVAPLLFVLAVNAIKEGYDDIQRHRNDGQVNNREVALLSAERGAVGQEVSVCWKDIIAGDIIKVYADMEVPADMLLLASPDPEHLCYVETANLDGETNLKIKYCWRGYRACGVSDGSNGDAVKACCDDASGSGAGADSDVEALGRAEYFQDFVDRWCIGCEAPNPR